MNTPIHIKTEGPETLIKLVELSASDLHRKPIQRVANDLPSFLAYLKRWGSPLTATVYFDRKGLVALFDERAERPTFQNGEDSLTFAFNRPTAAKRWLDILDKTIAHKGFVEFLEQRFAEIVQPVGGDFYTKIANLSVATTFKYDAKLGDANSYKIGFEKEGGGDVVTLPKFIIVRLPLVDGLDQAFDLKLKLTLDVPTNPDQKMTFKLVCDDLEDVFELAAKAAVAKVEADLGDDWLIVNGSPATKNDRNAPF